MTSTRPARPCWLLPALALALGLAAPSRAWAGPAGPLQVNATPVAHVTVDGEYRGVTPLAVKGLAPGEHKVELRTGSGRRWVTSVTLTAGKPAVLVHAWPAVKPGSRGALVVRSRPVATAYLDGKELGKTPTAPHGLPCLSYEVELKTQDGRTHKQTVFIEPGGDTILDWVFAEPLQDAPREQVGGLTVRSDPEAQLLVDGKIAGTTPVQKLALPPGRHVVKLRTEDGRTHQLTVTVVLDKVTTFTYQFPPLRDKAQRQQAFVSITASHDADITIDGKPAGRTPQLKLLVKPGTHRIVVTRADRKRKVVMVTVPAGFHRTVHIPF